MSDTQVTIETPHGDVEMPLAQVLALADLAAEHPESSWHFNECGCCVCLHPVADDGSRGYVIGPDGEYDWHEYEHEEDERMSDVSQYTLQVEREVQLDGEPAMAWVDLMSVTVPLRVKRKSALRQALSDAGEEGLDEARVRVLDSESAFAFTVTLESEPQLRIA